MKRIILCAILLGTACQAFAGTLYRWIEADGSITFSPQPPAAGIAYDTVQTGGQTNTGNAALTAAAAPSAATPAAEPAVITRPVPTQANAPTQGLNYAPTSAAALPSGISRANGADTTSALRQDTGGTNAGVVGSSQKFNQCQDLKKRVVSLERRLRSKLSPTEVDNTVVAIVRYQQSFDQYCL